MFLNDESEIRLQNIQVFCAREFRLGMQQDLKKIFCLDSKSAVCKFSRIKLTISLASFKIMKLYMHSGLGSFYGFLKLCLNMLSFVGFPLEMA